MKCEGLMIRDGVDANDREEDRRRRRRRKRKEEKIHKKMNYQMRKDIGEGEKKSDVKKMKRKKEEGMDEKRELK